MGNPLETALAISKLIFGGVLERLPTLRIYFAHGGGAFPAIEGANAQRFLALGATGRGTYRDVEFSPSLAYGGRFGHYFDKAPFVGLAVDVFNFSSDVAGQTVRHDGCFVAGGCGSRRHRTSRISIDAMAVSADLMLRLPLIKTAEEPHGVLQPYVAVDAPLFFTHTTTDVELRDAVRRDASFKTDLDTQSFLIGLSARW